MTRLGARELDAIFIEFVEYQARHATFTGGTANFFLFFVLRVGERWALAVEDMKMKVDSVIMCLCVYGHQVDK